VSGNARDGPRMTVTTAIVMIDMEKMYFEQHKRDVFGWPPIWRLGEVIEECRQLLSAGRAAGMPVIYTRAVQRPDGADAMPSMRRLLPR
jgi:ureidoacrylate peracid hydrolase